MCCIGLLHTATETDQCTSSLFHPPGSAASASSASLSHAHRRRRTLREVVGEFCGDVATVCRQRVWVSVCAAYTAYVAVLGVYAYWGPQVGVQNAGLLAIKQAAYRIVAATPGRGLCAAYCPTWTADGPLPRSDH